MLLDDEEEDVVVGGVAVSEDGCTGARGGIAFLSDVDVDMGVFVIVGVLIAAMSCHVMSCHGRRNDGD
jgi:hypothetical protein